MSAADTPDLFGGFPDDARPGPSAPPELVAARALCRRLKRAPSRQDKLRLAHLICLNLISLTRKAPRC